MRYFKPSNDAKKDIERIAGEMINICTNTKYFDKGVLVSKPTPNYNTYNIKGINYEVHPNLGTLIMLGKAKNIRDAIETAFKKAFESCKRVFGDAFKLGVGTHGTTQYMFVEEKKPLNFEDIICVFEHDYFDSNKYKNKSFVWNIFNLDNLAKSEFNIPGFTTYTDNNNYLKSLSAIIYDMDAILDFADDHVSPDYPEITQYNSFKNQKVCDRQVTYDIMLGWTLEIAKWFYPPSNSIVRHGFNAISETIFWMPWSDVKPRKFVNSLVSWTSQIHKGAELGFVSDNEELKCVLTGIPIYEDCYVLDMYTQNVRSTVSHEELQQYLADGYRIVEEVIQATNPKKKTKPAIDIHSENNKKRQSRKSRGSQSTTQTTRSINVNQSDTNQPDTNQPDTNQPDTNQPTNLTSAETEMKNNDALRHKKYLIEKTIEYSEPIHIVISPYAMHCLERNNGASLFEGLTASQVIIYRTFSPRTFKSVVESLDAASTYKNLLLAGYIQMTYSALDKAYTSKYQDIKYKIYVSGANSTLIHKVLDPSSKTVIAKHFTNSRYDWS